MGGFVFVGSLATLFCEVPERNVVVLSESVDGVGGRALERHGAALCLQVDGRELRSTFVGSVLYEPVEALILLWSGISRRRR
jgi:hypothetical protein